MIVDSSAVVALLNDEPDADVLLAALRAADAPQMSVASFGDCFAYALAKDTGEPLLFKGDDFGHTDVRSAL